MEWRELQQMNELYHHRLVELDKWKKQQEKVAKQLYQAKQDVNRYNLLLSETRERIELLEEETFLNRIKKLLGKHEDRIDEELKLAAERELKLNEAKLVVKDLEDEIQELKGKIDNIDERSILTKIELNKLKMDSWLKEHNPAKAIELANLVDRQHLADSLIYEVEEALIAGKEAYSALVEAASELDKAKEYSTWDTFLGGGIIATSIKHEKIRESNTYIHSSQRKLQKFQNELLDVKNISMSSLEVKTDGFVKFSDYFFDDIFSALSVHSKLTSAREKVQITINEINQILSELRAKLTVAEAEKQKINGEIDKIFKSDQQSLNL